MSAVPLDIFKLRDEIRHLTARNSALESRLAKYECADCPETSEPLDEHHTCVTLFNHEPEQEDFACDR